jgi:hypothetical protein
MFRTSLQFLNFSKYKWRDYTVKFSDEKKIPPYTRATFRPLAHTHQDNRTDAKDSALFAGNVKHSKRLEPLEKFIGLIKQTNE